MHFAFLQGADGEGITGITILAIIISGTHHTRNAGKIWAMKNVKTLLRKWKANYSPIDIKQNKITNFFIMKRGSLFFIGLLSAIITIISLNFAFGRSWHYNHYPYYARHHCYNERYDRGYNEQQNLNRDSTRSNY